MAKFDGPVEVWLTQRNLKVRCMIVHEDESTTYAPVESLSMRGAQREMSNYLTANSYEPVGRWQAEISDRREVSRKFTLR
jgi:hypothetical protein